MAKGKGIRERLSEWWKPSDLQKAANTFDREMSAILREATKKEGADGRNKSEGTEPINNKIYSAIINYINNIEQSRELVEFESERTSSFTPKIFELLQKNSKKLIEDKNTDTQTLNKAISSFKDACSEVIRQVWSTAQASAKAKNTNRVVEFAKDHPALISTFAALITACLEVFVAHKKDFISLAEVGKNSEGAKLGFLAAVVVSSAAGAATLAYTCLTGNSKEVQAVIEETRKSCEGKKEAFQLLAKANAEYSLTAPKERS